VIVVSHPDRVEDELLAHHAEQGSSASTDGETAPRSTREIHAWLVRARTASEMHQRGCVTPA
jgi:hypothetical protein